MSTYTCIQSGREMQKKYAVIVCEFLQMFIHFSWLKLYLVCDQKQLYKGVCLLYEHSFH